MTFSIVARDPSTKRVGVAVTTSSIAVGSRCPWVRAYAGAVATQNITDPMLGKKILDLIEVGDSAYLALKKIKISQPNMEYRQLTVVTHDGSKGHFTGKHILGINAVVEGQDCIAAGNLLANKSVVNAVVDSYETRNTDIHMAEALINALKAGLLAGGEEGEVRSAAVLVAKEHDWPEVDLRVDWEESDPVEKLYRLWKAYQPQVEDYITRAVSPADAPSFGVPGDE